MPWRPLSGSAVRAKWSYNVRSMRRLTLIAAFALVLAVPVWAQRGGHGGGGHFGGGGMHAGGFAGHAGGGHSFGGIHSGPGLSRGFHHPSHSVFTRGPFLNNGFRGRRFRTFGFRNNCVGFACRNRGFASYPWWGWGYGPLGWDWWDDDARFDYDQEQELARADRMNELSLEQQRMFRQEEADGDQDAYAPRPSVPRAQSESQPTPIMPPTVLVFRDQHREEVTNYAIVGQTLWNFSGQRTRKIPLADLDVVATEKANDDRGVVFRIPGASEGQ